MSKENYVETMELGRKLLQVLKEHDPTFMMKGETLRDNTEDYIKITGALSIALGKYMAAAYILMQDAEADQDQIQAHVERLFGAFENLTVQNMTNELLNVAEAMDGFNSDDDGGYTN